MTNKFTSDLHTLMLLLVLTRLGVIGEPEYNNLFLVIERRKLQKALEELRSKSLNNQDSLSKL